MKHFLRKRRQAKVRRIDGKIGVVNAKLDRTSALEEDERYEKLRAERARLFWKRNDLYAKLAPTKET